MQLLRAEGVEAYGADIFYEGANYDVLQASGLLEAHIVRPIQSDGRLSYADEFFDIVVSNQVFEHVRDIDPALAEIARVLKPEGIGYHHFPSREVIREGHVGIPLAHKLGRGRARYWYTVTLRLLGLGYYKGNLGVRTWTDQKLGWIDAYCYYRPYCEIRRLFDLRFVVRHREIDYCRFRARGRVLRALLTVDFLRPAHERLFRRLAFMALETERR